MNIGILAVGQAATSEPTEYLPKHIARRLHKRGWLDQVSRALFRRRATRREIIEAVPLRCRGYIPEHWPPREVPNTKFREPQSERWRLDHRTVRLESSPRARA